MRVLRYLAFTVALAFLAASGASAASYDAEIAKLY